MKLSATTLLELLIELRTMNEDVRSLVDFTELPHFGGKRPIYSQTVWSWDEQNILIGEGIGSGDFAGDLMIVPRAEFEGR